MSLINPLNIFTSKVKFIEQFATNDETRNQAMQFWKHLDSACPILLTVALIIGCVGAWYYYKPFNNQPGRHYKLCYWFYFLIGACVVSLMASYGLELLLAPTRLRGVTQTYLTMALAYAVVTFMAFLIVSVCFCKIPSLKTNAYKLI